MMKFPDIRGQRKIRAHYAERVLRDNKTEVLDGCFTFANTQQGAGYWWDRMHPVVSGYPLSAEDKQYILASFRYNNIPLFEGA